MVRFAVVAALVVAAAGLVALAVLTGWGWWIPAVVVAALAAVGVYDLFQRRHSVLRNYPVLGHLRYLLEALRPELQQYFIERNFDGRPYDRDVRSLIYERAKGTAAELSFGTERDIDAAGTSTWCTRPRRSTRQRSRSGFASAAGTAPARTTWRY